jgi:uncharacterized protein
MNKLVSMLFCSLSLRMLRRWVLCALVVVNGMAYMQARAMTQYAAGGARTGAPERLSLLDAASAVAFGVRVPRPENRATPASVGLPFTTHIITNTDDSTLEAWFIGRAEPRPLVLMFGAFAVSKDSLLQPAATLYALGYDALLVDFRGTGGSSGSDTTLGVREAEDVARSFAYAQATWSDRQIVLYGVSLGAVAAMKAIATHDVAPAALIIESPFDRLLTTVGNRFRVMGLPAFPGAELLVFWGSVQQGYNGFAHNPVVVADYIDCPTLLLHDDLDTRVSLAQARSIYERLAGTKQMVRFPDTIHASAWQADPARWTQHVAQFLEYAVVR